MVHSAEIATVHTTVSRLILLQCKCQARLKTVQNSVRRCALECSQIIAIQLNTAPELQSPTHAIVYEVRQQLAVNAEQLQLILQTNTRF
jgi:CRISPR/Cas system-associated endoribonuclease Cas2